MKQDERHHTSDDIFVGIDLATHQHQVVVLDAQGCRLTSFKVPHSRAGLRELVERCTSRRVRREGRVHFAFEATGHVWEAVGCLPGAARTSVSRGQSAGDLSGARGPADGSRQARPHRRGADRAAASHGSRHPVPAPPRQLHAATAGLGGIPSPSPRARTTQDPAGASALRRLPGTGRRVAHGHGSGMPRGVEGGLASSTNCRPDEARFYTSRAGAPARTADVALQD